MSAQTADLCLGFGTIEAGCNDARPNRASPAKDGLHGVAKGTSAILKIYRVEEVLLTQLF